MIKYWEDGRAHINVYSAGRTWLGRQLSNFAHTPVDLPIFGHFESIEGFYYWVHTEDDKFRNLWGAECKREGKNHLGFQKKDLALIQPLILMSYWAKLYQHPKILAALKESTMPLKHYYLYGRKVYEPVEHTWTVYLWEVIRRALKNQKQIAVGNTIKKQKERPSIVTNIRIQN